MSHHAHEVDRCFLALRRRNAGVTYRQIGEDLGVSTSQAHGLVKRARSECLRKAELIPRGPSFKRPQTPESALELLQHLANEFFLVENQALDHLDPPALAAHRVAFDDAVARLEILACQEKGRKIGLGQALKDATGAFHGVLWAAARSCEEFARVFGTRRNAETFAADISALGKIISPRSRVDLPPWVDTETLEPTGRRRPSLDRAARTERDLKIFLACLQGEKQGDIGEKFGLTDRQVRNIAATWSEMTPVSEGEVARLQEELAKRTLAFSDCLTASPSHSLRRAREDILLLLRALAAAKGRPDGGPTPTVPAGPAGLDFEAIHSLNASIRRRMEEADVPLEVIEDVVAIVVEQAGPSTADAELSSA